MSTFHGHWKGPTPYTTIYHNHNNDDNVNYNCGKRICFIARTVHICTICFGQQGKLGLRRDTQQLVVCYAALCLLSPTTRTTRRRTHKRTSCPNPSHCTQMFADDTALALIMYWAGCQRCCNAVSPYRLCNTDCMILRLME